MEESLICPRCGNHDFLEVDCGPDSWDDDICWTSEVCTRCQLWHSGWTGKWLVDCRMWQEEEDATEYTG